MEVTEAEYKQSLTICLNFEKQVHDVIEYFEKASDEEKKEIARDSKMYGMDKILTPIIEARKKEIKKQDKDPLEVLKEFMAENKKAKSSNP